MRLLGSCPLLDSIMPPLAVCCFCISPLVAQSNVPTVPKGQIRTYYVAAEELDWDYAPNGIDRMMNMPFESIAKSYMEHGPHRIGHIYKKSDFPRIHGRHVYCAEAASAGMGTRGNLGSDPPGRSRGYDQDHLQERRYAPLQHASAWRWFIGRKFV
jgi:hypothetical protein